MRPLSFVAALTLAAWLPLAVRAQPLPSLFQDLGSVRPFSLLERNGAIVTPESLRGKVWVAHFFFTSCLAGCKQTTAHMSRLHGLFEGIPDVAFVSITVDPVGDTTEVLKRFADQHFARSQWLFLTAKESDREQDVHDVIQKSFFQTAMRSEKKEPGYEFDHTFSLVLVDRVGEIRGYVDGRDPEAIRQLEERMRALVLEKYALARVNASLNGFCALLLLAGYVAIKLRKETLHTWLMVAALVVSSAFLACYLYYHFFVLRGQPMRFRAEGIPAAIYYTILITHVVLAAVVTPLALYVAWQGWRDRRQRHVRLARWTLPVWLYVSVTGVVVYLMLYVLYPPV